MSSMLIKLKLCFEKELADTLLSSRFYFKPALDKVTYGIIHLLDHPQNSLFLHRTNILSDRLLEQIYSDTYFGVIGKSLAFCPTQQHFIERFLDVLKSDKATLPQLIHLHQVFMQFIYDKLPFRSTLNSVDEVQHKLVKLLFYNNLFVKTREIVDGRAGEFTSQLGASALLGCIRNTNTTVAAHTNVFGKFKPHADGHWFKVISNATLPFIAGPSGHTGSSILAGKLVGKLSDQELHRYIMAVAGVLVGGGYHTFDEVMAVANRVGIRHVPGDYHLSIPLDLMSTSEMEALKIKYEKFFPTHDGKKPLALTTTFFNASIYGVHSGFNNYIYRCLISRGMKEHVALFVKNSAYWGGVLALNYYQRGINQANTQLYGLYDAAMDTADELLFGLGIFLIQWMMEKLSKALDSSMLDVIQRYLLLMVTMVCIIGNPDELLPGLVVGVFASLITERSLDCIYQPTIQ